MPTKEVLVEMTAKNNAFSKKTPGLQLTWDTGSLRDIKVCPRLYYLNMIEGWTPKKLSPHLFFGLITHSALETYDRAIIAKKSHDEGVNLAVRHVFEKCSLKKKIVFCADCHEETDNLEAPVCLSCNSDNIRLEEKHATWQSDHPNKNFKTLLRTVVWYLDHYKDSKEEVITLEDGTPAVEIWFRFELPLKSPEDEQYIMSGHIDKIVKHGGGHWFKDIKTTKSTIGSKFFQKFSPDNQMSFYATGGSIVFKETLLGGIIDGAQVLVKSTRFQRGFVNRTKGQIDEWLQDTNYWIYQAELYAQDGYWPMNDTACHQYGGCDYREICNKDPDSRHQFLKTNFKKQVWDPTKERK